MQAWQHAYGAQGHTLVLWQAPTGILAHLAVRLAGPRAVRFTCSGHQQIFPVSQRICQKQMGLCAAPGRHSDTLLSPASQNTSCAYRHVQSVFLLCIRCSAQGISYVPALCMCMCADQDRQRICLPALAPPLPLHMHIIHAHIHAHMHSCTRRPQKPTHVHAHLTLAVTIAVNATQLWILHQLLG